MELTGDKELKSLLREAESIGWRFRKGRRHILGFSPDGKKTTTIAVSPSDYRAYMNIKRDLGLKK